MFRITVLLSCLALCYSHAVLPLVPAVHAVHAPVLAPYSVHHGYAGHGLLGHGFFGHGLLAKPLGHHILKRSPHLVGHGLGHDLGHGLGYGLGHDFGHGLGHGLGHVAPIAVAPVAHVAPIAHVAPVAVSHQSRVDVKTAPAVIATSVVPVVKPVIAPVVHAAPFLHKSLLAAPFAGHGHYASVYPHHGGHY